MSHYPSRWELRRSGKWNQSTSTERSSTPCTVSTSRSTACTIVRSRRRRCASTNRPDHGATASTLKCATSPAAQTDTRLRQYIDSHVKPYRCAFTSCEDLKFSSLACRLRHEKEAHGAHGHGVRPFHCLYPECERSLPGHGFPRHWNRNDHMKRVHNHPETKRRKTGDANYVDPSTLEYISLGPDSNGVVDDGRFRPPAKRRRKA